MSRPLCGLLVVALGLGLAPAASAGASNSLSPLASFTDARTGGTVRMDGFQGRALVLFRWQTRCSACTQALADLNQLRGEFGTHRLAVLVVSEEPRDQVADHLKAHEALLAHQVVIDAGRTFHGLLGRSVGPGYVFADHLGRIDSVLQGVQRKPTVGYHIQQLLRGAPPAPARGARSGFHGPAFYGAPIAYGAPSFDCSSHGTAVAQPKHTGIGGLPAATPSYGTRVTPAYTPTRYRETPSYSSSSTSNRTTARRPVTSSSASRSTSSSASRSTSSARRVRPAVRSPGVRKASRSIRTPQRPRVIRSGRRR